MVAKIPAVAGTIKARTKFSNRKIRLPQKGSRTRAASREIARRIFNDKSSGAFARPILFINDCVLRSD